MIGLKSIGIAIAILCSLLVVGVQNSEAIKIVEFPSDTDRVFL